jgi:hypothetical protein
MKLRIFKEKISQITLRLSELFREIKSLFDRSRVDVQEAMRLVDRWESTTYRNIDEEAKENIARALKKYGGEYHALVYKLDELESAIYGIEHELESIDHDKVKERLDISFRNLNLVPLRHLRTYLSGVSGLIDSSEKRLARLPT